MGQHGLSALLSLAGLEEYIDQEPPDNLELQFDFAAMAALNEALESMYGARGGRGMALRIGRAAFAQGLKRFGVMNGRADAAFQALPLEQRMHFGLLGLASIFTRFSDQQCRVEISDDAYLFRVEQCAMAWGRSAEKPVCHAMVGILQECLRWASNGSEFYVRETACRATGSPECIFRINRTAIGEMHP